MNEETKEERVIRENLECGIFINIENGENEDA